MTTKRSFNPGYWLQAAIWFPGILLVLAEWASLQWEKCDE